jgi:hypothetical protein
MLCIVDFNGSAKYPATNTHHAYSVPCAFWADWDGDRVYFGGEWENIPPMESMTEPTKQQVYAWAAQHGSPYGCAVPA